MVRLLRTIQEPVAAEGRRGVNRVFYRHQTGLARKAFMTNAAAKKCLLLVLHIHPAFSLLFVPSPAGVPVEKRAKQVTGKAGSKAS